MVEKPVKVTNKGMISIPAAIRKKYNINDGDYILVKEDENKGIQLIPIESIESLRNKALTVEESREIFRQSRKEDMELER
ncbi:MAG: AbrB/MazE/SpoVT family DNA-binding domain-containing protein [Candidatus Lokiarchaeota archaeon]|nr:AbrB/MazE/SpoVT family DNA-binding domain-containing protein [Candidatus Lokiarchaeota archaeon]